MATDEFEPFRGLPLTRAQDAEIRAYIARHQANGEAWDTIGFAGRGCTGPATRRSLRGLPVCAQ